jgi:hypothetical protein
MQRSHIVSSALQLLAVCLALGATVDIEEERELEKYNAAASEDELDVTANNIAGLTIDSLSTFVPSKYVGVGVKVRGCFGVFTRALSRTGTTTRRC